MARLSMRPAPAAALAALALCILIAPAGWLAPAGVGVAAAPGDGAPAAPGEALAPGTTLEIVAGQADLLAMPPGFIRNVKAKAQNRIGVARHGARVELLQETENFFQIVLECQDGKVRIEAWLDKAAARPAPDRGPELPR